MPPSPVERSFSTSDVEELIRHCRGTIQSPFDLSASVGYGDKKDIFKILRPRRKFKGHRSVGQYIVRKFAARRRIGPLVSVSRKSAGGRVQIKGADNGLRHFGALIL